ncbi:ATP-binding cassette domain-containing protein [Staphylococcus sp. CH99b_3]|uniref:ABC transporter ATP-binding protein n=1 Tax=Staphylococcus sp. CH99b_3 TaxID=2651838 RepID=UPI00124D973C|nr:ATP-binding cassette domain-containing protein [Staphylococcus sp. CH99b_3]KAB2479066.1 ATP-binding cassette domain-containing protein [Staphylococcus sp. CH99b_3]
MLELNHVSYKIDKRTIIDDISLTVNPGEAISVLGPSGSGKSTLFRLMSNLLSPTEGTITLYGHPFEDIDPETLRMEVSFLLQQSDLFGTTIGENLAFPALARQDKFDKSRARKLLKKVGLGHYKLNTLVQHLSGGERQRITIARQLMYIPKVLLLDEATSALDVHNKENIETFIFELVQQGLAVVWITHDDQQSTRHFDKQWCIVDGKLQSEEVLT